MTVESSLPLTGRDLTYRFTRRQRLLKTDDFSSVFNLRRTQSNDFFQVWIRPNGFDHARLGVVAAKRVDKRAVGRNRIKRLVREQFRLDCASMAGFDLIVRAKRPLKHRCDIVPARAALVRLFKRFAPCRDS